MSVLEVGTIVIRGWSWHYSNQDGIPGYLGKVTIANSASYSGHNHRVSWLMRDHQNSYTFGDLIEVDRRLAEPKIQPIYKIIIDQLVSKDKFTKEVWESFLISIQIINQKKISLIPLLGEKICQLLTGEIQELPENFSAGVSKFYQPYVEKIIIGYIKFGYSKKKPSIYFYLRQRTLFSKTKYFENCSTISQEEQLILRNHLLVQKENTQYDWFGYHQLWDQIKTSKSLLCPLDSTKTCAACWEPLSREETEYSHGLRANCGCHYHLDCALDLQSSLASLARTDVKMLNLSCQGCGVEMTTEFYRNLLALVEYQKFRAEQRPKKVAELVSFFNVEGDLVDFVTDSLQNKSFRTEIDLLNQGMKRKLVLENALWVNPCPKCDWNLLVNPEEERFGNCPNCDHRYLAQGSTKKAQDDQARPALIELLKKNRSTMGYCKKCFKIINKNGGCSHMKCIWCGTDFDWNNDHRESDYSKIHY